MRYLRDVRGLSQSSVNHYFDALNNISRRLVEKGLVQENIYEIADLERLHEVRNLLLQDPDFVDLDQRGRRMYSAGLNNYIRFAEGEDYSGIGDKVVSFDAPMAPAGVVVTAQHHRKRSGILRTQAIEMANYTCEIDAKHWTFLTEASGKPYMEGHHAMPMYLQDRFDVSLDVYANIVCLCPVCHRKIHLGKRCDREEMAEIIFAARSQRLEKCGLTLTKAEFIALAAQ